MVLQIKTNSRNVNHLKQTHEGSHMFVRAYLRASTVDQDASRARDQLNAFAADRGLSVTAWYVENESGAKLARPELFRLLNDSQAGDVLLIEQVDRLSRLTAAEQRVLADGRGVSEVSASAQESRPDLIN